MTRGGRLAHLTQVGGLYVLLALLPFSKAAVEICFGVLLGGWVAERVHPATRAHTIWRAPQQRPLLAALIGYLAVCALSILGSSFPEKSVRGLVGKWLEYLLYLLIVADVGSRPGVARRGMSALALGAGAVALQAIVQETQIVALTLQRATYPHSPLGFYGRMTGPYENPIDLATYLMVVIPILMASWTTCRTVGRWLIGFLLVLLIGCLGRTQALGAWLGLGIGLPVLLWRQQVSRVWRAVVVGTLPVAALVVLFVAGRPGVLSLMDRGAQDRWIMWQAAIRMIQDRPWLGHGVNTFMANYLHYRVGGETTPRYAHNCYLQVAAETGLIGLAAFLWLLWRIGCHLVRGVRQAGGERRTLLLGLGGGLLAFLVQAGLDTNFYALRQAALFWVLSGLAIGLSCHQREA